MPRRLLLAATLVLVPARARAGCPSSAAVLDAMARQAETSFAPPRDFDRVEALARELQPTVACLEAALAPAEAADAHVVAALGAFLEKDGPGTTGAFQAARLADPAYRLPEGMVPSGHPLQVSFASAAAPGTQALPMRPADGLDLRVDGVPTDLRPADRPALLQATRAGALQHSVYLWPADPLPDWADAPPFVASVEDVSPTPGESAIDRPRRVRRGPSPGLLVAAGGAALASGGLWTATLVNRSVYQDNYEEISGEIADGQMDEDGRLERQAYLDDQARTVNLVGYVAQGTAVASGVLLVSAFVF